MTVSPDGILTQVLDYAADMLAATGVWTTLAGDDAREHIYLCELPRAWSQDIHSAEDLISAAPWAIVHFDDEAPGATFTFSALGQYVAQHAIVIRLYFVPPDSIDENDTNEVEAWVLNQVGRIIRGSNPTTSPGLLDLSHEPGNLLIRNISFLGPMFPSEEQRAADHALIVACELVLQTGVDQ